MLIHLATVTLGVLPYVQIPDFGPIHPFGVLVVIGILVGAKLASMRAKTLGLDPERFSSLVFWTVLSGIVISHVLDTIFYYPRLVIEQPWRVLMIWQGLSSFGGFFGAVVGFVLYSRRYKLPMWKSADAIGYGLPFGWFFGRMGCSVVHDHPGRFSDSFLAVNFPGGPRLDLGLLELLLTPILIVAVVIVGRRTKRPGSIITTISLIYPLIRFPLDFLRAPVWDGGDVRYFGLTPGHYASIGLFLLGLVLFFRSRRTAEGTAGTAVPEPAGRGRRARRA